MGKAGRGQSGPKLITNSLKLTVSGSSICRASRRERADDQLALALFPAMASMACRAALRAVAADAAPEKEEPNRSNTANAHLLRQMPHHPRPVSGAAAAQVVHGHETKQECCAKRCPGAWGAAGAVAWGSCAAGPAAGDGRCLKIRCCRTVLANTVNRAEGNAGNFPEYRGRADPDACDRATEDAWWKPRALWA